MREGNYKWIDIYYYPPKGVYIIFILDVSQYLKGCSLLDTAQSSHCLNISKSYFPKMGTVTGEDD